MLQKIARYEVKRELGRGGMAIVYLGYDPDTRREVAIKVLPRQFLSDPSLRRRFTREAEAIAKINHPNIVPVYDVGEHDDQPFIVMRYMAGGSLENRIVERRLPLEEVLDITSQISTALDYLHELGYVHRDIKPANILFDQRDIPHISDFGIAKYIDSASLPTVGIVGTPAYISPEQINGERDIDKRADIYSLGIMLFELLAGQRPFHSETPYGLAMQHLMEPIPSITTINPSIPVLFQTILSMATAKDRNARFQNAGSMAAALNSAKKGEVFNLDLTAQAQFQGDKQEHNESTLLAETLVSPLPSQQRRVPIGAWFVIVMTLVSLIIAVPLSKEGLVIFNENTTSTLESRETAEKIQSSAIDVGIPTPPAQSLPAHQLVITNTTPSISVPAPTPWFSNELISVENVSRIRELTILRNEGDIQTIEIAWSPNNESIAMSSNGGAEKIWHIYNNDQLPFEDACCGAIGWSPDERFFAVGSSVFDANDFRFVNELPTDYSPRYVSWSPDGSKLATANRELVHIWNYDGQILSNKVLELEQLFTLEDISIPLVWSPDGTRFASGKEIWDATTGEWLLTLTDISSEFKSITDWSPDGTHLITTDFRIWDASTGREVMAFDNDSSEQILWSPDGTMLASISRFGQFPDSEIRIWDSSTGQLLTTLEGHTGQITSIEWSPSGNFLASGGADNAVRVWGLPNNE